MPTQQSSPLVPIEIWQIPVSLIVRKARRMAPTFCWHSASKHLNFPDVAAWVYTNAGGRGYYRSSFDAATLGKMSAELETGFSPEERIHFLGDEWAMVRVGRLSIGDYLDTLEK